MSVWATKFAGEKNGLGNCWSDFLSLLVLPRSSRLHHLIKIHELRKLELAAPVAPVKQNFSKKLAVLQGERKKHLIIFCQSFLEESFFWKDVPP